MRRLIIFTIGHSNRSIEDFLELLKINRIEMLVDIRRFPTSKWEQFKGEKLKNTLEAVGVGYECLGRELGGYRTGGYHKWMQTAMFKKGVRRLLALARQHSTVIMCAEKLPWMCHRRFLSAHIQKLEAVQIFHIIDRKRTFQQLQLIET